MCVAKKRAKESNRAIAGAADTILSRTSDELDGEQE
jgi:hypothetical protein